MVSLQRRTTLLTLSDNILVAILENIIPYELDIAWFILLKFQPCPTITLSHICRRLRRIVLGVGRFWSDIWSAIVHPDWIRACVERSGDESLSIMLSDSEDQKTCKTLLDATVPQAHRWKSFRLYHCSSSKQPKAFKSLGSRLNLRLPQLEILELRILDKATVFNPNLVLTWTAPRLTELDLSNHVLPPSDLTRSITKFSFGFRRSERQRPFVDDDLKALQAFLLATPSIKEFCFTFFDDNSQIVLLTVRPVDIPNVTSMKIYIQNSTLTTLMCAAHAFRFPNLSDLDIELDLYDCSAFDAYFYRVMAKNTCYTRVSSLTIDVRPSLMSEESGTFTCPLGPLLPNLKHFKMTSDLVIAPLSFNKRDRASAFPPLQTVHFRKCKELRRDWVESFTKTLEKSGRMEGIQKITFENCFKLSKEDVEEVLPSDKSEWILNEEVDEETDDDDDDDDEGEYSDEEEWDSDEGEEDKEDEESGYESVD